MLTRERVLTVAVELADRTGIEAVTMRAVAESLGVEAMSLYHHLAGKDALLDAVVERVAHEIAEEIDRAPQAGTWQAAVRRRCLAARSVMLRHAWAPAVLGSRPAIPPAIMPLYEAILATMIDAGLSYHLGHRALHALGSMVLGFVNELFRPASATADADADNEFDSATIAGELPHIAAMVASEIHSNGDDTLGWCDSQAEFEFTLNLILEGLDRKFRAEKRARSTRGRPRSRVRPKR